MPAPSPSDRTISFVAGSTSTSTYRSRAMANVSKPGPRLAADAGTRARTPTRYSPRVRPGGPAPPPARLRPADPRQLWMRRHHHDGSGTVEASLNGIVSDWVPREYRAVPTLLPWGPPGGTGSSTVAVATCWPGHPRIEAVCAATTATRCCWPPHTAVTEPTRSPALATVVGTTPVWAAVSRPSTTGRVWRKGSGSW